MYKKAAESVSTEDTVPLVVNVVHIDDSSMELTEDGDTQFVINDVTWIMGGNSICHIYFIHLLREMKISLVSVKTFFHRNSGLG